MVSTQEYIYTIQWHFLHPDTFTNGCLVAQVILHWDACTHKCPWARTLVGSGWKHNDLGDLNQSGIRVPSSLMCRFTHKNAWRDWREMFLCTSAFRQKYLFTEMISERGTFSRRRSQTGVFKHWDAFSHGRLFFNMPLLLHTSSLMERCFCPQMLLHRDTLALQGDARAFIQR